MEQHFTGKI